MEMIRCSIANAQTFANDEKESLYKRIKEIGLEDKINSVNEENRDVLGWFNVREHCQEELIKRVEEKASEIRKNGEVFVLIGVGGSNQGARAVIKALGNNDGPEILYAGINLSPSYMNKLIAKLEGKEVYINIIAKNFTTLEPGLNFRILRQYLEKRYGEKARDHIVVTGSLSGDELYKFSREKGYDFFEFPYNMGGRYSIISAVGLLPIAVAGIDIRSIICGAEAMEQYLKKTEYENNPAVQYAVMRNALYQKGYNIEILSFFNFEFEYFAKWWIQLFAESEGKEGKGIFPASCSFSEDLHSVGQYIQEGRKNIIETFIHITEKTDSGSSFIIEAEKEDKDKFGFTDGKDLFDINQAAYEATLKAHYDGGTPCIIIEVPKINAYYMGQLFYFFSYACYVSGVLLGINPFDQPGVEMYKKNLFQKIRK